MSQAGIVVNLVFMVLNLLPILPLDGGRILASLLPSRAAGSSPSSSPGTCRCCCCCCSTNVLNVGARARWCGVSDALIRAIVL